MIVYSQEAAGLVQRGPSLRFSSHFLPSSSRLSTRKLMLIRSTDLIQILPALHTCVFRFVQPLPQSRYKTDCSPQTSLLCCTRSPPLPHSSLLYVIFEEYVPKNLLYMKSDEHFANQATVLILYNLFLVTASPVYNYKFLQLQYFFFARLNASCAWGIVLVTEVRRSKGT